MREKMLTLEERKAQAEARLARARAVRAAVERRLRQEQRRLENSRKFLLGAVLGDWIAGDERKLTLARQHLASVLTRDVDFAVLRVTPFEVSPPSVDGERRDETPSA